MQERSRRLMGWSVEDYRVQAASVIRLGRCGGSTEVNPLGNGFGSVEDSRQASKNRTRFTVGRLLGHTRPRPLLEATFLNEVAKETKAYHEIVDEFRDEMIKWREASAQRDAYDSDAIIKAKLESIQATSEGQHTAALSRAHYEHILREAKLLRAEAVAKSVVDALHLAESTAPLGTGQLALEKMGLSLQAAGVIVSDVRGSNGAPSGQKVLELLEPDPPDPNAFFAVLPPKRHAIYNLMLEANDIITDEAQKLYADSELKIFVGQLRREAHTAVLVGVVAEALRALAGVPGAHSPHVNPLYSTLTTLQCMTRELNARYESVLRMRSDALVEMKRLSSECNFVAKCHARLAGNPSVTWTAAEISRDPDLARLSAQQIVPPQCVQPAPVPVSDAQERCRRPSAS